MESREEFSGLAARACAEKWGAFSFQQGLQTLVDRLVERISDDPRVTIYENEDNVQLSQEDGTFTVHYAEGETVAEHLFACVPAKGDIHMKFSRSHEDSPECSQESYESLGERHS